jgi:CXXC-20-CXXC protein
MKRCSNYNREFTFKELFTSFWKGYKPIECNECNHVFSHKFKNRWLGGISIGITTFSAGMIMNNFKTEIGMKFLIGFLTISLLALALSSISMAFFSFEKDDK